MKKKQLNNNKLPIIVIIGPTGSGKSDYAFEIASKINSSIINSDSLQIYKYLPILSAQPSLQKLNKFDCKLYSVLEPTTSFSVYDWLELATIEIKSLLDQRKIPIIVGGTGMYAKSLIEGINEIPEIPSFIRQEALDIIQRYGVQHFAEITYDKDPLIKNKIHMNDKSRLIRAYETKIHTGKSIIEFRQEQKKSFFAFERFLVLDTSSMDRDLLYKRCNKRFIKMLTIGAIEEVRHILDLKLENSNISKTLGFKEIARYLKNEVSKEFMIEKATQSTRNYAKRQLTWFRNQMPYKKPLNNETFNNIIYYINKFL